MYTFKVADVEENTEKCKYTKTIKDQFLSISGPSIESCSNPDKELIFLNKGLVDLTSTSFSSHYPLILDPDTIWITITTSLAKHINQNAEALRKQFVSFEGKVFIEIFRDDFIKGNPNNPWDNCFPEFSDKIAEYIGDKRDLIVSNFSTTDSARKVISEIVLMDAVKSYFSYGCSTCCGIPRITLEGTVEDWKEIRARVDAFDGFGLSWWTEYLKPALDEFVNAANGNPNLDFWKSFYNQGGGSGGPFVGGNVTIFYPFLGSKDTKNNFDCIKSGGRRGSLTLSEFPKTISSVPFSWNYYGTVYPMEFLGGLVGAEQEEDGSVRSSFNWAVKEAAIKMKDFPIERLKLDMPIWYGNKCGILKKVEAVDYGDGSKKISDVYVDIDGETKHFKYYDLSSLYIKGAF